MSMNNNWETVTIAELSEKIGMGPFGSNIKVETFVPKGVPIISGAHLKGLQVLEKNFNFITEEHAQRLRNSIVFSGDIIFTHAGNVGQAAMIPYDSKYPYYMISQRQFYMRCNKKRVLPEFVVLFFHSREGQGKLLANVSQVGVPSIAQPSTYLKKIELCIPDIYTQNRIVNFIFGIEQKIELNNCIIANLEAQAQAIFKSWFVDFEPFQDGEFEESELGLIPKGWRIGTLDELIDIRYGKDHKKLGDGNIPVYGSGGIMRFADQPIYEGESVLIPRKGTLSNVLYATGQFWTVDTMFYTIMRKNNIAKFVYLFVLGLDLASMNSGSAVPSMTTNILNAIQLVIPKDEDLESFETVVSPMYRAMKRLEKQNDKLTQLRDTLLPKLMSGKIEVPVEGGRMPKITDWLMVGG